MSEPEAPPAVQKKADWLATISTAGDQRALSPVAFEPTDLPSLVKVAELFSRSNLVPEALRQKPDDVLLVLWTGREYGFGMIAALKNIHVIKGTTTFSADALHAMVAQTSHCEYFHLVSTTDQEATYETKRRGSPAPVALSYTLQMARQAGLLSKPNWSGNPAAMLRAAAKRSLARAVYGDLIAGLHTPDELDGPEVIDVTPAAPPAETKAEKLARNAREKRQAAAPVAPSPPAEEPPVIEAEVIPEPAVAIDTPPPAPAPAPPAQESLLERAKRPYYRGPDFVEALEARAELANISRNELAAECLKTYGLTPRELPDPKWKELTSWIEKEVARVEEAVLAPPVTPDHLAKILSYAEVAKYGAPDEPEVAVRKLAERLFKKKLENLSTDQAKLLVKTMIESAQGAA